MERYCAISDSWAEVSGGELGTARAHLGALVVHVEVDLLDSLIAKAKTEEL